jgi:hypothetical protein
VGLDVGFDQAEGDDLRGGAGLAVLPAAGR